MKENSSIKEKALHPEQVMKKKGAATEAAAATTTTTAEECGEGLDERICTALRAASDKKGIELIVLDLRAIASFTDYFLIASGTNVRQVQAIADEIVEQLKKQGTRAARVEGYNTGEWVLVDYGDFVVHVFEDKARRFYDLERLWRDAVRIALPPELAGGGDNDQGSLRNES
ncbi:MAG TPA: ribosome silencing factor [Pyrinomonadaceae bacterium]|jgi:ribosome-associated protein|nr:ribosome silencing factor [Pyrinomonadaceae bacterium]